MWQRNDEQAEAASLQNRFTAYLVIAVRRRKEDYIEIKNKRFQREIMVDEMAGYLELYTEPDMLAELPLLMQMECENLVHALTQINMRERYVFLSHVLDEKSFEELATELQIGYKGVAAIYYRTVQKIKHKMGVDKSGL